MKKRWLFILIVGLLVTTGCGKKKPGIITVSLQTNNGVIDRKLEDEYCRHSKE